MSVQACAGIVQQGDPDRFLATMAAPPALREVLFPLYAFNVEISRAPWVTQEPLLAEMRLQWWADVLDEIQSGGPVRKHEVTDALKGVLTSETAQMLQSCVDARRRDARREPFETPHALAAYVKDTAGTLHKVAMRAACVKGQDAQAEAVGSALGLANYLLAVPALLQRNMNPLPEMTNDQLNGLLRDHIAMADQRTGRGPARAVHLAAWRAKAILKRALKDQTAIVDGRLSGPEFTRRASLLWRSLRS